MALFSTEHAAGRWRGLVAALWKGGGGGVGVALRSRL